MPQGSHVETATLGMGYDFRWYDLATRYTWQYLTDATSSQLSRLRNAALESDNRLVFKKVMQRLFSNTNGMNEDGTPVYGL